MINDCNFLIKAGVVFFGFFYIILHLFGRQDVDPMCQLRRGEYFLYLSYTFVIFYSYFDNRLK